jgi:hypothetical protein
MKVIQKRVVRTGCDIYVFMLIESCQINIFNSGVRKELVSECVIGIENELHFDEMMTSALI